jgi:hypothetical protein
LKVKHYNQGMRLRSARVVEMKQFKHRKPKVITKLILGKVWNPYSQEIICLIFLLGGTRVHLLRDVVQSEQKANRKQQAGNEIRKLPTYHVVTETRWTVAAAVSATINERITIGQSIEFPPNLQTILFPFEDFQRPAKEMMKK